MADLNLTEVREGLEKFIDGRYDTVSQPFPYMQAMMAARDALKIVEATLDAHLPTIIVGLSEAVHADGLSRKDRADRTPTEVGLMAALSAAHWIAKDIAGGGGEPLYDLPSVQDLMKTTRKLTDERDLLNADVYDEGVVALGRLAKVSVAAVTAKAENPYRVQLERREARRG